MKSVWLVAGVLLLAGCGSTGFAPIRDDSKPAPAQTAKPKPVVPKSSVAQTAQPKQEAQHTVEKGDTLFAIAFQHALDYRDLAFWNNLTSPDLIKVGQVLRLTPPDDAAGRARGVETIPLRESALPSPRTIQDTPLYTEPRAQRLPYSEANWALLSGAPAATAVVLPKTAVQTGTDAGAENPKGAGLPAMPATSSSTTDSDEWRWPVDGALLGTYGEGGGKGINIAGERLTPVVAAAPGKVVYSGAGLRGYGKMLIVKHAGEYLSAYAHNQTLMVKEGDWVKGGQKIAEMGDTDSDCVKLHFEIRQYGKPVDPLKLLPERK